MAAGSVRLPIVFPKELTKSPEGKTVLVVMQQKQQPQSKPGTSWTDWYRMAEASLTAAAELIWQTTDETDKVIQLWKKVTSRPISMGTWKNYKTWRGATLLSLAAEQSMKGFITQRGRTVRQIHPLLDLWCKLDEADRDTVAATARDIGQRVTGTKLALPDNQDDLLHSDEDWLQFIRDTLTVHNDVHVTSRYFAEGPNPRPLERNIELWRVAFALYLALK